MAGGRGPICCSVDAVAATCCVAWPWWRASHYPITLLLMVELPLIRSDIGTPGWHNQSPSLCTFLVTELHTVVSYTPACCNAWPHISMFNSSIVWRESVEETVLLRKCKSGTTENFFTHCTQNSVLNVKFNIWGVLGIYSCLTHSLQDIQFGMSWMFHLVFHWIVNSCHCLLCVSH